MQYDLRYWWYEITLQPNFATVSRAVASARYQFITSCSRFRQDSYLD